MCKSSIWDPKYIFSRNTGFLEGLCRSPLTVFGLSVSFPSPWASVTLSKQQKRRGTFIWSFQVSTQRMWWNWCSLSGKTERGSPLKIRTVLRKTPCARSYQRRKVSARTGEDGGNSPLAQILPLWRLKVMEDCLHVLWSGLCAVIVMWAHLALAWLHLWPQVVLLTYGQQCHVTCMFKTTKFNCSSICGPMWTN